MSDVEELVAEARKLLQDILAHGNKALRAGADPALVEPVVMAAIAEIEQLIGELQELRESLPPGQDG